MAVGARLHLPGFARPAVEEACEFPVKRSCIRIERFKFIVVLHEAASLSGLLLKHKMLQGDVKGR
jgi:hypothetical protein